MQRSIKGLLKGFSAKEECCLYQAILDQHQDKYDYDQGNYGNKEVMHIFNNFFIIFFFFLSENL